MEANSPGLKYSLDHLILIKNAFKTDEFWEDGLGTNPERLKLYHLQQLLSYHSHRTLCANAVEEFKGIIIEHNNLESEEVRIWVDSNIPFFKENLFSFGYTYTDEDGKLEKDFYLPDYCIYIDRTTYVPIIQYWLLMKNLYFGEYYKNKEDRSPAEVANPKDYYYQEPDPSSPSDIEVVKSILELK